MTAEHHQRPEMRNPRITGSVPVRSLFAIVLALAPFELTAQSMMRPDVMGLALRDPRG